MMRNEAAKQPALIEGRTYTCPTQAVILAGGRGTRMQPITLNRPKPMVPVNGRPFLEYQIEQLKEQGFNHIVLLLGYLPECVQRHFGDGSRWGVRIDYSIGTVDELTSTRIQRARDLLDPCFLLLYCDNYWPMDISRMWSRFVARRKPAMITVYSNKDGYSKGGVRLDAEGDACVFDRLRNQPDLREVEISYAILTDRALELLSNEDMLVEEAVYTPLAEQGRLAAFSSDHRYYSVGSLNRLPATERFLKRIPTVILDRDGVLNVRPPRAKYVRSPREWRWLPGALDALRLFKQRGYQIIVVTNQPGIARGMMREADLTLVHERLLADARKARGPIDAIYHCPHGWDEGCDCRKPKPGMLFQAQKEFCLDLSRTFFVGDDDRDEAAAVAAGCAFERVDDQTSLYDIAVRKLGVPSTRKAIALTAQAALSFQDRGQIS